MPPLGLWAKADAHSSPSSSSAIFAISARILNTASYPIVILVDGPLNVVSMICSFRLHRQTSYKFRLGFLILAGISKCSIHAHSSLNESDAPYGYFSDVCIPCFHGFFKNFFLLKYVGYICFLQKKKSRLFKPALLIFFFNLICGQRRNLPIRSAASFASTDLSHSLSLNHTCAQHGLSFIA